MTGHVVTGAVNHVTLTVSDVDRSREFYTSLLGFQQVAMFGPRAVLTNGSTLLVVGPAPDHPLTDDRFDENRIGLDHVSFTVGSRADLEQATRLFDERGVSHGEIKDLADFRLYVLAFRDPDNIQLELTAPYS